MTDHSQHLKTLQRSLGLISWAGDSAPGALEIKNVDASFSVVVGQEDELAVVAAGVLGESKVVAFGHDGFLFSDDMWDHGDNLKLHFNIIRWMSQSDDAKIGIFNIPGLADKLCDVKFSAEDANLTEASQYTILYCTPDINEQEAEQLKWYLHGGGNVVVAATGWGWQQLNPDKSIGTDFLWNQVLDPFGLSYTDQLPTETASPGYNVNPVETPDEDCSWLIENVNTLSYKNNYTVGSLSAIKHCAFPVVVGKSSNNDNVLEPVVVASWKGDTHIVAFAHDGFLTSEELWDLDDNLTFQENILDWVTDQAAFPRIGVIRQDNGGLAERLRGLDFEVEEISPAQCQDYDIVYCCPIFDEEEIGHISEYLKNGGGLVIAATGWGWQSLNSGKKLDGDFAGNKLLSSYGIVWTDNYTERTCDSGFTVDGVPPVNTSAFEAWCSISSEPENYFGSSEESTQLFTVVKFGILYAPLSDCFSEDDSADAPTSNSFMDLISNQEPPIPSTQSPVNNTLDKLRIIGKFKLLNEKIPTERHILQSLADPFPGFISSDNYGPSKKELFVNTRISKWHSTGIYAPPGEYIHVFVPAHVAGNDFAVRIGCHTDTLWHLESWSRFPEITSNHVMNDEITSAVNAFGGLVYIEVPEDTNIESFQAEIVGGIPCAHYKLGETSDYEWQGSIRHNLAPFGELESTKVILSVPQAELSRLENPRQVLEFWDQVIDTMAELVSRPMPLSHPERIVFDAQLSCGYMHAGYPIVCYQSDAAQVLDVQTLRTEGNWGFFHELGHNFQEDDWTFDGTVEVTCNLFTLYVFEKVVGIPACTHPRGAFEFRKEHMDKYNFIEPNFEYWKEEPFLALVMYEQLIHFFGWGLLKSVFSEYRNLSDDEKPKNDDEKRDQWLTRLSHHAGHNLEPFFKAWGVPTTPACAHCIQCYPKWQCPEFECLAPHCRPCCQ